MSEKENKIPWFYYFSYICMALMIIAFITIMYYMATQ